MIQKCVGMSYLVNKSTIVFLAITKPYLQLFFQLLFFWEKIMCCCITYGATSWIMLNFTKETDTFITMYNIIKVFDTFESVSSTFEIKHFTCSCQDPYAALLLHKYLNMLFRGFCITILSFPKDCRIAAVKGFEPAVQQSLVDSRKVPYLHS